VELIRDTCSRITTLEQWAPPDCAGWAFNESPTAAETLDLLESRRAIPSLDEIVVNLQIYTEADLTENRMKKIRDCEWPVKIMKLRKKFWISMNEPFVFEIEEFCS
jgi:hypothetical protein